MTMLFSFLLFFGGTFIVSLLPPIDVPREMSQALIYAGLVIVAGADAVTFYVGEVRPRRQLDQGVRDSTRSRRT